MRVFSVPVSAPFLRTVIAALVDGRLVPGFEARSDPARLAEATLYLPTRRAMRVAREVFLDELKSNAAILPRIVGLGDIDEDELAFAEEAEPLDGVAPLKAATNGGWVLEDERFEQQIAKALGRRVAPLARGRQPKADRRQLNLL